jgi:hypothetical protein
VPTATRMCLHKLIVRVVLDSPILCDTVILGSAVDLFGLFKGWDYRRGLFALFRDVTIPLSVIYILHVERCCHVPYR